MFAHGAEHRFQSAGLTGGQTDRLQQTDRVQPDNRPRSSGRSERSRVAGKMQRGGAIRVESRHADDVPDIQPAANGLQ